MGNIRPENQPPPPPSPSGARGRLFSAGAAQRRGSPLFLRFEGAVTSGNGYHTQRAHSRRKAGGGR